MISLESNSKPSEPAHFFNAGNSSRMLTGSKITSYYTYSAWEHEYFFLPWFCSSFSNQIRVLFFVSCLPALSFLSVEHFLLQRECQLNVPICSLNCCAGKNRSGLSSNSLLFCRYRHLICEQQMILCLSVAFIFTACYPLHLGTALF